MDIINKRELTGIRIFRHHLEWGFRREAETLELLSKSVLFTTVFLLLG